MAASDHLSPVQFMPLGQVGNLISNDTSFGLPDDEGTKVWEVPFEDIIGGTSEEHYAGLKASIAKEGIREPLEVKGKRLMEGHHRFYAAKELGLDKIPVRFRA